MESAVLGQYNKGNRDVYKRQEYWNLNYDLLEMVKIKFDEAGIEIPYEHLDVIVHEQKE